MHYFVMINHPAIGVIVPLEDDDGVALYKTRQSAYEAATKNCLASAYGFDIYPVPINEGSRG